MAATLHGRGPAPGSLAGPESLHPRGLGFALNRMRDVLQQACTKPSTSPARSAPSSRAAVCTTARLLAWDHSSLPPPSLAVELPLGVQEAALASVASWQRWPLKPRGGSSKLAVAAPTAHQPPTWQPPKAWTAAPRPQCPNACLHQLLHAVGALQAGPGFPEPKRSCVLSPPGSALHSAWQPPRRQPIRLLSSTPPLAVGAGAWHYSAVEMYGPTELIIPNSCT